jgi:RimJ/RimL family protein N-acetyltransferase
VTSIRTERLLLDTLTLDEAIAICAGDRAGRRWVEDYPTEGDVVVASIALEAGEHYDESATFGVLQMRWAATGEAIGGIGFISAPAEDGSAEIGYGLAESFRRRGLATEAVRAVCAWAAEQQDVRSVVALTALDNGASQSVLVACGFLPGETVDGGDDGPMLRWELALHE